MKLMAPIPGMSLTQEPGNSPYEQPPLYDKPEDALAMYFEKFNDEDIFDDVLFALSNGFPLEDLVDSMTSVGAMEGYHSLDVKMMIAPVIHEYLSTVAESAGIDFVEMAGPSKEEKMKSRDTERTKLLLQKAMAEDVEVSPEAQDEAEEAFNPTEGLDPEAPVEGLEEAPEASSDAPLIQRRT